MTRAGAVSMALVVDASMAFAGADSTVMAVDAPMAHVRADSIALVVDVTIIYACADTLIDRYRMCRVVYMCQVSLPQTGMSGYDLTDKSLVIVSLNAFSISFRARPVEAC